MGGDAFIKLTSIIFIICATGELSDSNDVEEIASQSSTASSGRTQGSRESRPEKVSLQSHRNARETTV